MHVSQRIIILLAAALTAGGIWYISKHQSISAHSLKVDMEGLLKADPAKKEHDGLIHVAILGSGPAGCGAALYCARENMHTLVFNGPQPGGQLTTTSYVENWPGTEKSLGSNLMTRAQKQAEHFGAIMVYDAVERVDFSSWPFTLYTEEGKVIKALSVIIATGANSRKLGVPGEEAYSNGKGVTSCAVCDAPYFKDKKVVVVGGGDSAVEEAVVLASFAKEVTILVRSDKMRAAPAMFNRLSQYPNIKVLYNSAISEIVGNDEHVTGIQLISTTAKDGKKTLMPIDGVFLGIGHIPNTGLFKEYLDIDDLGYIVLSTRTQRTSLNGIFSAGDVSDTLYKQAGVAAGDGIKAGLDAIAFLRDHGFTDTFAAKLEKHLYDPYSGRKTISLQQISNMKELDEFFKENSGITILDFYAPWCPSCLHMIPVIESVGAQFEGSVSFAKVDVSQAKDIAAKYKAEPVPWIMVFKDGVEVARTSKIMAKRALATYISEHVY